MTFSESAAVVFCFSCALGVFAVVGLLLSTVAWMNGQPPEKWGDDPYGGEWF